MKRPHARDAAAAALIGLILLVIAAATAFAQIVPPNRMPELDAIDHARKERNHY